MKTIIPAILLLLYSAVPAQEPVRPLAVGDRLPDFESMVINNPASKIKLSSLKGKILVFDFWTTYCSSCIKLLTKADSLQKLYAGDIQIIPVTYQKKETAQNFLLKNAHTKNVSLPVIVEDKFLEASFPHDGVPYTVWVDRKGTVIAMTGAQYVNAKNIRSLINNQQVNWNIHKKVTAYPFGSPLLTAAENGAPKPGIVFYTTITRNLEGVPERRANFIKDTVKNYQKFTLINYPVLDLYKWTLKYTGNKGYPNRILLEVRDSIKYVYDELKEYKEIWQDKFTYCYEAVVPPHITDRQIRQTLREDLNRYFNLNGRNEKRMVSCLALTVRDSSLLPGLYDTLNQVTPQRKQILFASVTGFINDLNIQQGNPPIIDKTGITGRVSLLISTASLTDIETIRGHLHAYGLDLSQAQQELEVFVLTEPGFHDAAHLNAPITDSSLIPQL